jgi:hypothetical protein
MNYKSAIRALLFVSIFAIALQSGFAQSKPIKKKTVELKDAKGNDVGMATPSSPRERAWK